MGLKLARATVISAAALAGLPLASAFVAAASIGWGPGELADHGLASIPWIVVGFVPTGAILAWQRPRNPIGWLLLATGFVAAAVVAAIPGTVVAVELGWPWWLQVVLANFLLGVVAVADPDSARAPVLSHRPARRLACTHGRDGRDRHWNRDPSAQPC